MPDPILFDDEGENPFQVGDPPKPPEDEPKAKEPAPEPEPPKPTFGPEDMTRALLAADAYRQQEAQRAQAWKEYNEQMAKAYEPPPLPTGEEAEQLILDEEALLRTLKANQEWTKRALELQRQSMAEHFQTQLGQIQANAMAPVMQMRAEEVFDAEAERLEQMGVPDGEAVLDALHQRLRQNPQTYWNLVTNQRAIQAGVDLMLRERGYGLPPTGVAAPVTAGYTPSSRATSPSNVRMADPAIRAVERLFEKQGLSKKWTDDDLGGYNSRVQSMRRQGIIR